MWIGRELSVKCRIAGNVLLALLWINAKSQFGPMMVRRFTRLRLFATGGDQPDINAAVAALINGIIARGNSMRRR